MQYYCSILTTAVGKSTFHKNCPPTVQNKINHEKLKTMKPPSPAPAQAYIQLNEYLMNKL